jgi:hypothetical protein
MVPVVEFLQQQGLSDTDVVKVGCGFCSLFAVAAVPCWCVCPVLACAGSPARLSLTPSPPPNNTHTHTHTHARAHTRPTHAQTHHPPTRTGHQRAPPCPQLQRPRPAAAVLGLPRRRRRAGRGSCRRGPALAAGAHRGWQPAQDHRLPDVRGHRSASRARARVCGCVCALGVCLIEGGGGGLCACVGGMGCARHSVEVPGGQTSGSVPHARCSPVHL